MKVNGTEYNTGNIIYTTRGADMFHFSENGIMSMIIEDFEVSNGKVRAIEHGSFMDKSIELGISTTYKLRDNAVTALRLNGIQRIFLINMIILPVKINICIIINLKRWRRLYMNMITMKIQLILTVF